MSIVRLPRIGDPKFLRLQLTSAFACSKFLILLGANHRLFVEDGFAIHRTSNQVGELLRTAVVSRIVQVDLRESESASDSMAAISPQVACSVRGEEAGPRLDGCVAKNVGLR